MFNIMQLQRSRLLFRGEKADSLKPTDKQANGWEEMRILLVEDDAEAAAYAAKGLRGAGHVVDHALDEHAWQRSPWAG